MPDQVLDLSRSVFAKTAVGQQEVQTRALKLGPLPRRLLILVDGKRSVSELTGFVAGSDINVLLTELLDKACIEATAVLPASAAPKTPSAEHKSSLETDLVDHFLEKLPDASTRSAKEVEMAKNFMMNTVNTIFQPNTRLTLLESIFACKTVQDVRNVYPKWTDTMNASAIGARRMPEFREKLLQVL
ncbi:MAG: hypothetical protein CO065_04485 [Comamonadaceae bacterium CG_4_9_14_0_8_um_filter_57_21]|nr:MAG: hypothetical protein COY49_13950 [Comamonadaceae bacterium CG_4_10_14_0_8_um_filter_57_29]PJC20903.1 MAG: hypothetical protein CO065_04485 [Comamonadaceae bacterium CG_4_9_14_0_8_um_filter_57_21]